MTGKSMRTSLQGIANKAVINSRHRFGDLYRLLNEENLRDCFYQLRKDAACGVDRVTFQDYEENLDGNIRILVEKLKAKRYRAKLVRRKYIPKPGSKKGRPLGIPALEDKLLQKGVAQILSAIYEQDFLDCSYGYRKGLGPHDALEALREILPDGTVNWVVEADIRGFFDNMDHNWLVEMLELRINDKALIRLIKKWLKAGILEETGEVIHPGTGCPQGGLVSPVLANIYLHYALDLWFEKRYKKTCEFETEMVRYADDFICMFRSREEAERFEKELKIRLGKFSLEVAEEKTQTLMFSRGGKANGKFDFLGFEFRWGRSRWGQKVVKRRTSPKKLQASIAKFTEWVKENRHKKKKEFWGTLKRKLLGYANYYAIEWNSKSVQEFYNQMVKLIFKWLNRRSDRRSYTWERFNAALKRNGITCPRIQRKARQLTLGLKTAIL